MAAATVTVYEATLKQGWTQQQLEDQFYKDDPLLENIERRKPSVTIGLEAITPVHTGRGGGYTAVPKDGAAALNTANPQQTNRARWEYRRHWNPIKLDTAAIKRSEGNANAVADAADTEITGNISDLRKQITRQLFLDQTGLIAQCAETTTSTTIKLLKTGLGYQAIRNGWLGIGQEVDIGTKTEEAVKADKKEITAVSESETEPTITIAGSNISVGETHYVSIANARSGETCYENNGFRNLTSETTELGKLNPTTVPGWKGVVVKAEGGAITRERVLGLRRKVRQKGETPDWAFTSLKQVEALENQLYPQVRFANPKDVNTGDGETIMVGSIKVQGHQDCPDEDFNLVKSDKIAALRESKPNWVTQEYEGGKILRWDLTGTYLVSAIEYFFELYTNRRNALGAIRELG